MQNNDSHSHEMQKGHNNNHKQQNPKKLCSTSFFHTIAFNWIQRINCQTRMNSHTHNFPTSTSGKCTHNTIFWLFLIRFVGREQFFFCFLLLSCVIFKTHSLENRRHCLIHSNLNHRCVKQKHTIWKRVCQSWSFFSLFRYVYSFLSTMVALLKIVLVPTNWNFSSVAFVWKHEPHNTIKFNISWMKCIQIGKISERKLFEMGRGWIQVHPRSGSSFGFYSNRYYRFESTKFKLPDTQNELWWRHNLEQRRRNLSRRWNYHISLTLQTVEATTKTQMNGQCTWNYQFSELYPNKLAENSFGKWYKNCVFMVSVALVKFLLWISYFPVFRCSELTFEMCHSFGKKSQENHAHVFKCPVRNVGLNSKYQKTLQNRKWRGS